jgi:hypothetical protein
LNRLPVILSTDIVSGFWVVVQESSLALNWSQQTEPQSGAIRFKATDQAPLSNARSIHIFPEFLQLAFSVR